jgi:hypothetical protein
MLCAVPVPGSDEYSDGPEEGGQKRPTPLKVGKSETVQPPAVQHRVVDLIEILLAAGKEKSQSGSS